MAGDGTVFLTRRPDGRTATKDDDGDDGDESDYDDDDGVDVIGAIDIIV